MEKLDSRPQDVRAKAYDLVLNGVEIGAAASVSTGANCRKKYFPS